MLSLSRQVFIALALLPCGFFYLITLIKKMFMVSKFNIFFSLLLFLFVYQSSAQTHEVGLNGGIANYKGEISPNINLNTPKIQAGIFYRYNRSPSVSFRFNAYYAKIEANDASSKDAFALRRNHQFTTNIIEVSGQLEYNFLNFRGESKKGNENWTPYALMGIGVCKFNPIQNIQPNYEVLSLVLPLGIGMKVALNERWNIGLECGARFTFTDLLDDLGTDVNQNQEPLDSKYYSGNPNDKDMYFFTNFSLSYVFLEKGKACPIKIPR